MAQHNRSIAVILAFAAAALLSACDFGSGGSGVAANVMPPESTPVAEASTTSPVAGNPAEAVVPVADVPATGTPPRGNPVVTPPVVTPLVVTPPGVKPPVAANVAPTISGTAMGSIATGQAYSFQPSAADANSDALSFSISNKPAWMTFNLATGKISGTATGSQVGSYANIVITVSDGVASASLAPFSINVTQVSTGSASLSWIPPTQNTDGSALINLAGYKIYYGASSAALTQSIQVTNPGLSAYVVSNLGSGTTYFAIAAYSATGTESALSAIGSKTI